MLKVVWCLGWYVGMLKVVSKVGVLVCWCVEGCVVLKVGVLVC